jgi:hypothetical protein
MSMSSLSELQGDFQAYLLEGESPIDTHVVSTERVPAATRLGIYLNAYRARLAEALRSSFPALAELAGEEGFHELSAEYIQAHPSRFASLRYYGDELASFLSAHADYSSAPLLAELARWEWAIAEVFDAADADPIDPRLLQQVAPDDWSELTFDWHPSVRQLSLEWNAPQIWKAITDGAERPSAEIEHAPVPWLIWRRELQILFRSPSTAEATALGLMRAGMTFGALCEQLCDHFDEQDAPSQAAAMLGEWVHSGLIVGLR